MDKFLSRLARHDDDVDDGSTKELLDEVAHKATAADRPAPAVLDLGPPGYFKDVTRRWHWPEELGPYPRPRKYPWMKGGGDATDKAVANADGDARSDAVTDAQEADAARRREEEAAAELSTVISRHSVGTRLSQLRPRTPGSAVPSHVRAALAPLTSGRSAHGSEATGLSLRSSARSAGGSRLRAGSVTADAGDDGGSIRPENLLSPTALNPEEFKSPFAPDHKRPETGSLGFFLTHGDKKTTESGEAATDTPTKTDKGESDSKSQADGRRESVVTATTKEEQPAPSPNTDKDKPDGAGKPRERSGSEQFAELARKNSWDWDWDADSAAMLEFDGTGGDYVPSASKSMSMDAPGVAASLQIIMAAKARAREAKTAMAARAAEAPKRIPRVEWDERGYSNEYPQIFKADVVESPFAIDDNTRTRLHRMKLRMMRRLQAGDLRFIGRERSGSEVFGKDADSIEVGIKRSRPKPKPYQQASEADTDPSKRRRLLVPPSKERKITIKLSKPLLAQHLTLNLSHTTTLERAHRPLAQGGAEDAHARALKRDNTNTLHWDGGDVVLGPRPFSSPDKAESGVGTQPMDQRQGETLFSIARLGAEGRRSSLARPPTRGGTRQSKGPSEGGTRRSSILAGPEADILILGGRVTDGGDKELGKVEVRPLAALQDMQDAADTSTSGSSSSDDSSSDEEEVRFTEVGPDPRRRNKRRRQRRTADLDDADSAEDPNEWHDYRTAPLLFDPPGVEGGDHTLPVYLGGRRMHHIEPENYFGPQARAKMFEAFKNVSLRRISSPDGAVEMHALPDLAKEDEDAAAAEAARLKRLEQREDRRKIHQAQVEKRQKRRKELLDMGLSSESDTDTSWESSVLTPRTAALRGISLPEPDAPDAPVDDVAPEAAAMQPPGAAPDDADVDAGSDADAAGHAEVQRKASGFRARLEAMVKDAADGPGASVGFVLSPSGAEADNEGGDDSDDSDRESEYRDVEATLIKEQREWESRERAVVSRQTANVSARHAYIQGCRDLGLAPEPFLIRSMEGGPVLKLGYYGLGDKRARALAKGLEKLPHVEVADLRDNRLGGVACAALVRSLREQPNLVQVDIAQNQCTRETAEEIRVLVASSTSLRSLRIAKMGIDDRNVDQIVPSLKQTSSLEILSIDHNNIGPAGGQTLGHAFGRNESLRRVNMCYNRFGPEGVADLSTSLTYATCLIEVLDLSWNAFGDAGAAYLGEAITHNKSLRQLELSHNNIRSQGAVVLAEGMRRNGTLMHLTMDGNAIGRSGARAFMRALGMDEIAGGKRRKVGLKDCSIQVSGGDGVTFDPSAPAGDYELDLAEAFDRTVLTELLRIAKDQDRCEFTEALWTGKPGQAPAAPDGGPPTLQLRLYRRRAKIPRATALWNLLREHLGDVVDYTVRQREMEERRRGRRRTTVTSAASSAAAESSDEEDEFGGEEQVQRGTGVGLGLKRNAEGPTQKAYLTVGENVQSFGGSRAPPGAEWRVPRHGTLKLSVKMDVMVAAKHKPKINMDGLVGLIQTKKLALVERMSMLSLATQDLFFTPEEAQMLLNMPMVKALEGPPKVEHVKKILFRLTDTDAASEFISTNLSDEERSMLQQELGQAYRVILGNPTGHYRLDLSEPDDRDLGNRLIAMYGAERDKVEARLGKDFDVSQHGNHNNFRNETMNGEPVEFPVASFAALESGFLEFDFVSFVRPPKRAKRVKADKLEFLLYRCRVREVAERVAMELNERDIFNINTPAKLQLKARGRWRGAEGIGRRGSVANYGMLVNDADVALNKRRGSLAGGRMALYEKRYNAIVQHMLWNNPFKGPPEYVSALTLTANANALPELPKDYWKQRAKRRGSVVAEEYQRRSSTAQAALMLFNKARVQEKAADEDEDKASVFSGGDSEPGKAGASDTPRSKSSVEMLKEKLMANEEFKHAPTAPGAGSKDGSNDGSRPGSAGTEGSAQRERAGSAAGGSDGGGAAHEAAAKHVQGIITGHDDWKLEYPEVFAEAEPLKWADVSDDTKLIADRMLLELTDVASSNWFNCKQVESIVREIPQALPKYRVEVFILLFARIVDLKNVHRVLWAFTLPERKEVVCRIGWLCLWNPLLPDGMYHLDMSVWEDHKLAELLVKLAVVEPGENWEDETYNPTGEEGGEIDGWELPMSWVTEVPHQGKLTCYYTSTSEGCKADIPLRREMRADVLTWA